jgi:hypothetical protein
MRKLIFSSVFGMKANYRPFNIPGWDKIVYTDDLNKTKVSGDWKLIKVDKKHEDPRRANRYYKWYIQELFKDKYDYVLYIDSKNQLKNNKHTYEKVESLYKEIEKKNEEYIGLFFKHPHRNCVYDECNVVQDRNDTKQNVDKIRKILNDNKFERQRGLTENNIFIVKVKHPMSKIFAQEMWKHQLLCKRDQTFFMYIIKKLGIKILIKPHNEKIMLYI